VAKAEIKLEVRLTPRARREEISGVRHGVLQVRVKAPPVDGRANEALRMLIAKRAGVPKSQVTIARGERSRQKLLVVRGADPDAIRALVA
jgi:uncharacterized protein